MNTFYLGTHKPNWLGVTDVPLFISRRTLAHRKRLPRALGRWSLDSGGFSELSLFGEWTIGPVAYTREVRRYASEIGQLDWAAIQDWMCEPFIVAKTGLTVAEHQARTIRSYLTLRDLSPALPWTPVLQGYRVDDYLRHVDDYGAAGIDLSASPVVGLGSVCRRQATAEIRTIVGSLAGYGLRLHGFGVKRGGLRLVGPYLHSADSLAWSYQARRRPAWCGSRTHRNCANCIRWALHWRQRMMAVSV